MAKNQSSCPNGWDVIKKKPQKQQQQQQQQESEGTLFLRESFINRVVSGKEGLET